MVSFFNWRRSNEQITVIRYGPPVIEGGVYVFNPVENFKIWASVQPLSKTDQDLVKDQPRLNRFSESLILYSNELLIVDDDSKKLRGDTVIIEGDKFRVFSNQSWQHLNLKHYRHLVVREN